MSNVSVILQAECCLGQLSLFFRCLLQHWILALCSRLYFIFCSIMASC